MPLLHLLFCVLIYTIAIGTVYLFKYKNNELSQYQTIDGLRGFLALGVFIHHAAVWKQYLLIGIWQRPPSNLYAQLGETSVTLFFMITSFLFVSKLINQPQGTKFKWNQFFVGRIFRIVPLYYFSLLFVITVVFYKSNWQLITTWIDLTKSIGNWALFTINAIPSINKFEETSIVMARVVWSLPYEWFFYICLPLMGLVLLKTKPSALVIFISLATAIVFFQFHGIALVHVFSFAGGAIAPFVIKYKLIKFNINNWGVSLLVVIGIVIIGLFSTAHHIICKTIITLVFTGIACGNNVFGLLHNKLLKLLGTISYSTYLLHGIVLYIAFKIVLVQMDFTQVSILSYSLIVVILTPVVVSLSYLSYVFIEKPFMLLGKQIFKEK